MKIEITNCLISLKNASKLNKKFVLIKLNSKIFKIIQCLYKESFIITFYILPTIAKIKVILKNDTLVNFFSTLKILTTNSFNFYIKYLDLSKLIFKHRLIFISTTQGILTGKECKKRKIGGTVLFIN